MFWSQGKRVVSPMQMRKSCKQQSLWNRITQPQTISDYGATSVGPSGVLP